MCRRGRYVIGSASGSVIVAGVHLCGALAIKAIALFNRHREKIEMICLKPCCLPGRIHAAREETWTVRPVPDPLRAPAALSRLYPLLAATVSVYERSCLFAPASWER